MARPVCKGMVPTIISISTAAGHRPPGALFLPYPISCCSPFFPKKFNSHRGGSPRRSRAQGCESFSTPPVTSRTISSKALPPKTLLLPTGHKAGHCPDIRDIYGRLDPDIFGQTLGMSEMSGVRVASSFFASRWN